MISYPDVFKCLIWIKCPNVGNFVNNFKIIISGKCFNLDGKRKSSGSHTHIRRLGIIIEENASISKSMPKKYISDQISQFSKK